MQAGFSCRSIASISTAPMAQCRLEYCCEGRSWKNFMPAAPAQTLPAGRLISAWKRTERVSRDGCAEGGCRKSRKSTGGTWWGRVYEVMVVKIVDTHSSVLQAWNIANLCNV